MRTEPERFRFRVWDDDLTASVFDVRSGETHGLSTLALELLYLLDRGALTVAAMAGLLDEDLGGPGQAEQLVRDEVDRLERIGMVKLASG